ncbi:MAG: Tm-1-like ATP-binding domain-containing protein [Bacteroidales bacterium]|nr:Tm-1-like ATP-binding domain-containing protein [Bacteroidales bacterium]
MKIKQWLTFYLIKFKKFNTRETANMKKTIVVLATLDTKEFEVEYLKNLIETKGFLTIVIDTGILDSSRVKADIPKENVAEAGGTSLKDLIESEFYRKEIDRAYTMNVIIKGAILICKKLHSAEKLHGLISLGGSSGTTIGISVMKELPIGIPKLMVTTRPEFTDEGDITIMQAPVDILGLNKLIKNTLALAAGAITGMVDIDLQDNEIKPAIGITSLGVTTQAVMKIKSLLEKRGMELIVFHNRTKILEKLIEEDLVNGIIDLTPNELVKIFIMKTLIDRKDRLEIAGQRGLPQIIVPGGLDMLIFSTQDSVKQQSAFISLKDRKWCDHGPYVRLIRTNAKENEILGKIVAERANRARGPIAVVIPMKGFSARDKIGEVFYNQEIDKSFIKTLKFYAQKNVDILEINAHINDDIFAKEIVNIYITLLKKQIKENWD